MPYTMNGFGTKYYGRREPGEDGSYVTTLWITALYIPIVPLGSYRVLPVGAGTNYVVHRSQNYQVLRVPMCWEQVWHIYMIGAPILIIIAWLIWSSAKKDRMKESLRDRLAVAGNELTAARQITEKVRIPCLDWFNSTETTTKKIETLSAELHDKCAPWAAEEDANIAKIDRYQQILREGVSAKFIEDEERSSMNTELTIWNIRRHQEDESKQIATCMASLTHACYDNIFPVQDSIKSENKQVCSLLATIGEKCN